MNQTGDTPGTGTPSFRVPRAYLGYIRLLEFVSFRLAAREIRKRFFSPVPFPTPQRERDFLKQATREQMTVSGRKFSLDHLENDGPVVVFIHGWSGRGSQAYALAPALHREGYHVMTITAPAHGGNPGKQTHMLQFADALNVVHDKYGPFYGLIGHSLGGMAAFNAMYRGAVTEKLVIMASPSSVVDIIADFCRMLSLNKRYADYLRHYLNSKFEGDIEAFAPHNRAGQFSHVKGLIIHDKKDIDVDYGQAVKLHEKWPGSELILTEGLGHRRILSDEHLIQSVIKFIGKRDAHRS